jgi:hypothetical protein
MITREAGVKTGRGSGVEAQGRISFENSREGFTEEGVMVLGLEE